MFINKKAVKRYLKDYRKRTSKDFLIALNGRIKEILDKAILASNSKRTVLERDLNYIQIKQGVDPVKKRLEGK